LLLRWLEVLREDLHQERSTREHSSSSNTNVEQPDSE
jgi:hypothetical protein